MTIEGSKCDDPPEPATERPSRAVVGHDLFVTHQLPEDELVRTVRRSATTSASDARQELALVAPGLIEALKGDSDGFRLSEPQELAKSLACHLDRSLTFAETSSPFENRCFSSSELPPTALLPHSPRACRSWCVQLMKKCPSLQSWLGSSSARLACRREPTW